MIRKGVFLRAQEGQNGPLARRSVTEDDTVNHSSSMLSDGSEAERVLAAYRVCLFFLEGTP